MIKLKEISASKTSSVASSVAYHVAESEVRTSIEKYGLDPNKYDLKDRTTGGKYIYLSLNI